MALRVIENNLKTIFDQIYVKSMPKIDKSNNKNIFLCHLNNSTKNNVLISFCNEEIWNYFDSLDSGHPPIITENLVILYFIMRNRPKNIFVKGQLISKCLFGVIVWTKKNNEIFSRISALASKNRSNLKRDILLY